jgi:hypothetical protein
MRTAAAHINLLQRSGPRAVVGLSLLAILAATLTGLYYYGSHTGAAARAAQVQRDGLSQQIKQVQAALAVQTGEQARRANALALRGDVVALEPAAFAAKALVEAYQAGSAGRAEEFARVMSAMTALNEPGLWLTGMGISAGGKKLEVQGETRSSDAALRFARRANESLKPLSLRLDSLEVGASAVAAAGAASAPGAAVSTFRLY